MCIGLEKRLFVKLPSVRRFNCGVSALNFLNAQPAATVTSFDICIHPYVGAAKQYIDLVAAGRHTLIYGDSTIAVPAFHRMHDYCCDMCFVDGGHTLEIARKDCANAFAMLRPGGFLVVDDVLLPCEDR